MPKQSIPPSLVLALVLAAGCSDLGTRIELRPQSELSALALDFGTVAIGQTADRTLTVRNTGTATLSGQAAIDGDGYEITTGGGSFSVPPGGEKAIVIRFSPAATGTFPASLGLGAGAPSVSLTGTGANQAPGAAALAVPASIDFGFVPQGLSETRTFEVESVGSAPVLLNVVSAVPGVQVIVGGGPVVLDPGRLRSVTLQYSPPAGGRFTGEIDIGPGLASVAVEGVGVTVSFASDVYPIFQQGTCAGCHLSPSWMGANAATTHANLVNQTSLYYPPAILVKPFEPSQSVLHEKVWNTGQFGGQMPPGGALLPAHQREAIRSWILEGALNN
jgi:hypothetical protein